MLWMTFPITQIESQWARHRSTAEGSHAIGSVHFYSLASMLTRVKVVVCLFHVTRLLPSRPKAPDLSQIVFNQQSPVAMCELFNDPIRESHDTKTQVHIMLLICAEECLFNRTGF